MLWREIVLLIFDDLSVIPSTASEALERNEMFYFTGKKCSKGHLSLRYASTKHCKMCSRIREKLRWADNKSRNKCLDKQRRWRKQNFEYFQSYMKEWRSKNQEKVNTARRKWAIKERSRNKSYRLGLKLKNELTRTIRRNGKYIDESLIKLVGCDNKTFRSHIESMFDDNMSWNNRGTRGWHFDHIRPTTTFDLLNKEELEVCFNYRNIQPLWSTRNNAKQGNFSEEDELLWVKHMKKLGFEGELFLKSGCLEGTRASVEIESTTAPVLAPALLSQEH